ncbi:hypothetical protein M0804_014354 [Polistes exclamans]|nr:hypothetical protein M0804_014354 [Polistes exclamans]
MHMLCARFYRNVPSFILGGMVLLLCSRCYCSGLGGNASLFLNLHKQKTNVIGTVRHNRKNMPKDLSAVKLKPGEHLYNTCNGILAVRWKDKRDVQSLVRNTQLGCVKYVTNIKNIAKQAGKAVDVRWLCMYRNALKNTIP